MKQLFLFGGLVSFATAAQPRPDFALRFDQTAHVLVTYRNNPRPVYAPLAGSDFGPDYMRNLGVMNPGTGRFRPEVLHGVGIHF